jgi:hypothetical protein
LGNNDVELELVLSSQGNDCIHHWFVNNAVDDDHLASAQPRDQALLFGA